MSTVIFVNDVLERFTEKADFFREIVSRLTHTQLPDISEQIVFPVNGKPVAAGGCDKLGRCNKELLMKSCAEYEVVIMPCIAGRSEYEAKCALADTDCSIIEVIPPRIRQSARSVDADIIREQADAMARFVKKITA